MGGGKVVGIRGKVLVYLTVSQNNICILHALLIILIKLHSRIVYLYLAHSTLHPFTPEKLSKCQGKRIHVPLHPKRGWRQRANYVSPLFTLLLRYSEILSQICRMFSNLRIGRTHALLQFSCSSITTLKDVPRTWRFLESIVFSVYLFTMIGMPIRNVKIYEAVVKTVKLQQ